MDFFLKKVSGRTEVEEFSGILIHKAGDVVQILLGVLVDGSAFRDESSDEAVLVLVGTPFGTAIRVTIVNLCPLSF